MSKANALQTNFTAGEVSPQMFGRVDVAKYQNGAKKIENFIVRTQGGISKRSGTRYVAETRDSSRVSRLVPFEFSDTQNYALEFGRNYIRVHSAGQIVLDETYSLGTVSAVATNGGSIKVTFNSDGTIPVGVSAASPANEIRLTSTNPHGLITGDVVIYFDVPYYVRYVSATVIDLQGSTYSALGATNIYVRNIVSGSANNGGLIRLTTLKAHGLRTGDMIYMAHRSSGVDFSGTSTVFEWVVTVIDDTHVDLVGSVWVGSGANYDAFVKWPKIGEQVKISGNTGTMELNGTWRIKSIQFHDVLTLANSAFAGTTSGTIRIAYLPVEIVTDYLETELSTLKFAQSADVIYIFHGSHPTMKLLRYSSNVWKFQQVTWLDGPYLPVQAFSPTINPSNPEQGNKVLDVFLEVSNYTHTALVRSAVNFTDTTDDDGSHYLEYRLFDDQWRLAHIQTGGIAAGDLKTALVDIVDNVMLFLDDSTRLRARYSQTLFGRTITSYVPFSQYRTTDPNAEIQVDAASVIVANQSNVFSQADIGKFLRYNTAATPPLKLWAQITGCGKGDGSKAAVATPKTMAAISTSGTGLFTLDTEVRSATVKAKRGQGTFALFLPSDVGRLLRLGFSGRWTWGKITAYVSSSQVTVTFYENIPRDSHDATKLAGDGMTFDWRLGAWSNSSGYPRAGCFHEQRLCAGGTSAEPQTEWQSRSGGDFENMSPTEPDSTVTDDCAITYTIVSGKVNPIRWMSSGPVMLLGGLGQEWQGRAASSIQEPMTPTNTSFTPQTGYGSSATADPQRIGYSTLFVNRSGVKVRELTYDFQLDAFTARDVSIIAEHIPRDSGGIVFTENQKDPVNICWLTLADGTLAGITYEKDQEIVAWHRHLIGGSGIVESVAVLTTESALTDHLYMIVKRTINGVIRRYVEYMEVIFKKPSASDKTTMFFMDAGLTFNFTTPRSIIEGLNHLANQTIKALVDGIENDLTVSAAGVITLAATASIVSIGLQYYAKLQTLPPEAGGLIGTSQTRTKRTNKIGIRVIDSLTLEHSNDDVNYDTRILGARDTVGNFYTGDDVFTLVQGYNHEGSFYLRNGAIEPLNIVLLTPELKTYEEQ